MWKKALLVGVCGGCAFLGGLVGTTLMNNPSLAIAQPGLPPAPNPPASTAFDPAIRFEEVVQKVSPAVVSIEAVKPNTSMTNGKGRPIEESGSGVMVRLSNVRGTIVITNNHVISSAPKEQITVSLADNRLLKPIRVWADPESDIALLQLESESLPTIPLGDSDRMKVGSWVLAFGSPFGLSQTVTQGIISARERGQISLGSTIRIKDFLQTDAAINPGSSGGPLVNLEGEVIGINTAIASQSGSNSGIAFSIPINLVKRIARQLIEKGNVSRGYLGVQLAQILDAQNAFNLGLDRAAGALVEVVYPDTPAAKAGLRVNDVILEVEGIAVRNENHLINMISAFDIGRKVKMIVWRERRKVEVTAEVGDWNRVSGIAAVPTNN